MSKESTEIFLPLNFSEYKENKVALLKTSLLTVKSIERLNKIKELKQIKHEQRKLLKAQIKELNKHYSQIKSDLPKSKEIKIAKHQKKNKVVVKEKVSYYENSALDSELSKIQEKIKNLNI